MKSKYLKVPVEMALFALKEAKQRRFRLVQCYLALQFMYSGNASLTDRPARRTAKATGLSEASVYRHLKVLLRRNWLGKNSYGRYYFRSFERVHEIENWIFARAAMMQKKDLQTCKAFMAGVVFASLAETRKGQQAEQSTGRTKSNRSKPPAAPISLSLIADTLEVSTATAYRLRKLADDKKYIRNEPKLVQVTNWTPNELTELKKQDLHQIPVELLGYADRRIVPIERVRYKKKKLFLQEPNLVKPLLQLKSRRGLSKYVPPNP